MTKFRINFLVSMYKYGDNSIDKSFLSVSICDIPEPFIGQNNFVLKAPFVGSINSRCLTQSKKPEFNPIILDWENIKKWKSRFLHGPLWPCLALYDPIWPCMALHSIIRGGVIIKKQENLGQCSNSDIWKPMGGLNFSKMSHPWKLSSGFCFVS